MTKSSKLIKCTDCGTENQPMRTKIEDGIIREGRTIETEEIVFFCKECGYLFREQTEHRRNAN